MSSDLAVKVEGLGKRYLLPHRRTVKKSERLLAHLKEYLPFMGRQEEDYFWALKNLDFEVRQGEILGILGRNGSGKSTLLKILSGVAQPTTGRAFLKGRIASLLEVGTGFHPDLTGRENVFMSGALLGIGQKEIRSKFDEIVDFSGIEQFIDMPVKRYSSGMYVRLAYAVASLLRSDILILDEVMAVGDAGFREKSQENIEKIANDGCTVLFVSHNARAVTSICKTGMILDAGECVFQGGAKEAVAAYLRSIHHYDTPEAEASEETSFHDLTDAPRMAGDKKVIEWVSTHALDGAPTNRFRTGQSLIVRIGYSGAKVPNPYFSVLIQNEFAERVATIHSTHARNALEFPADGVVECRIDDLRLGDGTYRLMVDFGNYGGSRAALTSLDCVPNAAPIHVDLDGYVGGIGLDAYQGAVHKSVWTYGTDDQARLTG
jgi:lipopolysaccharide transport system ATP-binding protein